MNLPLGFALALAAAVAFEKGGAMFQSTFASASPAPAASISKSVGGSGGTSSQNQALGKRMMLAFGWAASQWPYLQKLWQKESGWDANAVNPSSGAAGIPQALGHGHPFSLGDAHAQIAWGLGYIRSRYGTPAAAWAHELAYGWY